MIYKFKSLIFVLLPFCQARFRLDLCRIVLRPLIIVIIQIFFISGLTTYIVSAEGEPVPCSDLELSLKEFHDQVQTTSVNPETGDSMNYLLVGNADTEEAILFIPGTRGVLPDWPLHLFTNTNSSPNLIDSFPKAKKSLCSLYLLIFIDYPGVGGSVMGNGGLLFENISKDISDVITAVTETHGINITKLHIFG